MINIKEKIIKVAENDSPVMVIGESGTGKELVVESIHSASSRCNKPFISLNCAAIPDSLMESIIFGTVKGSFTGAENRKGIFEIANSGTLFLDEINSMSVDLQAKLLKVVEEQRYMKIGGEKYINVDVRIISAMNVTPDEAINKNMLRKDLFYRLGVMQFNLPPLKERKEDIDLLVDYFITFYNSKMHKKVENINELVHKIFMDYSWPGNVRELRNVIEYAFNVVDDTQIRMADIPDYLISYNYVNIKNDYADNNKGLTELMDEYEKDIILNALENGKSLSDAAKSLKLTRQALKYKIDKHEINYQDIVKK